MARAGRGLVRGAAGGPRFASLARQRHAKLRAQLAGRVVNIVGRQRRRGKRRACPEQQHALQRGQAVASVFYKVIICNKRQGIHNRYLPLCCQPVDRRCQGRIHHANGNLRLVAFREVTAGRDWCGDLIVEGHCPPVDNGRVVGSIRPSVSVGALTHVDGVDRRGAQHHAICRIC